MNIFEKMHKESSSKSEIYLYEENGKWYARECSVVFLTDFNNTAKEQFYSSYEAMKEKLEVDLNQLLDMNWLITLCSDTEIMLIKTD